MQEKVFTERLHEQTEFILTKRISENLRPTSARSQAEAGRQNFERIPAAIRGRKKPFANRIREMRSRMGERVGGSVGA